MLVMFGKLKDVNEDFTRFKNCLVINTGTDLPVDSLYDYKKLNELGLIEETGQLRINEKTGETILK